MTDETYEQQITELHEAYRKLRALHRNGYAIGSVEKEGEMSTKKTKVNPCTCGPQEVCFVCSPGHPNVTKFPEKKFPWSAGNQARRIQMSEQTVTRTRSVLELAHKTEGEVRFGALVQGKGGRVEIDHRRPTVLLSIDQWTELGQPEAITIAIWLRRKDFRS